jgi:hypothetical protein
MSERVLIAARNHETAVRYARRHGIVWWSYISGPEVLLGYRGVRVLGVGEWRRGPVPELDLIVRQYGLQFEEVPDDRA